MRIEILIIMLIIPWLATLIGSIMGSKLKTTNQKIIAVLLGFAAGVMVAASVWSLIIPSFDYENKGLTALIATLGFILGILLMILLDHVVPHHHMNEEKAEGRKSNISKPLLLIIAVAIHNIPEGIALGIIMAASMNESISLAAAVVFAIGLALQNLPEGLAVVYPLKESGVSEKKCLKFGFWASLAEPLAAIVGFFLSFILLRIGHYVMPLLLCIAAGAMIFIVVEELIPASQSEKNSHLATYGFLVGFWVMAVLAIVLS